tara:strand:+ start:3133 stop:4206 length:1074 start_codon:yes stop_codon:yes gene_type:complete
MAKKQKEEVAEEPKVLEITSEDKLKVKKPKTKKFENTDNIIKVDLSKKPEVDIKVDTPKVEESEKMEQPIVEITEEKKIQVPKQPDLPEGIQKVVEFMKETGGDLNDYMNLNRDFNSFGDDDLLRSYYKETKPHLNDEEINFLVEDNFSWDEQVDNEKDVKRKKLALKEQVASAKSHLDGLKSKYYEDIKMGSKLTQEQQDAIKFFEESKERYQSQEQAQSTFLSKTEELFNDEFKGFEYKVGDKRFRYNVADAEKVKTTQSDINNFVKKFLNENSQMENASGYHKGLFTAMNSDAIANHFYEQGKADALRESISKSKNINMDPRKVHSAPTQSGVKVRVLGEDNSNRATFKVKKRK